MNREIERQGLNRSISGLTVDGQSKQCKEGQQPLKQQSGWNKSTSGALKMNPSCSSPDDTVAPSEKKETFIDKLILILKDAENKDFENIISWEPDGKSFKVHKIKDFETKILPSYLQQTKLRSFQRQLIKYGFSRIQGGAARGAYQHPKFVKSNLSSSRNIEKVKKGNAEASSREMDSGSQFPAAELLGPMSDYFKQAVKESRPWSSRRGTTNTNKPSQDQMGGDWINASSFSPDLANGVMRPNMNNLATTSTGVSDGVGSTGGPFNNWFSNPQGNAMNNRPTTQPYVNQSNHSMMFHQEKSNPSMMAPSNHNMIMGRRGFQPQTMPVVQQQQQQLSMGSTCSPMMAPQANNMMNSGLPISSNNSNNFNSYLEENNILQINGGQGVPFMMNSAMPSHLQQQQGVAPPPFLPSSGPVMGGGAQTTWDQDWTPLDIHSVDLPPYNNNNNDASTTSW
eukprot:Nitzschia sp. Nitz4//scaffold118_size93875//43199//44649//NITZ4_004787-RA/size93875-augustus-gene-0.84-mRNA-1//1//CDS//3329533721//3851//frame0